MKRVKKVGGYLIVEFSARDRRDWDSVGLGRYGVIDAECYTGDVGIDRGAMEYDGAETLDEAVELARGLQGAATQEEKKAPAKRAQPGAYVSNLEKVEAEGVKSSIEDMLSQPIEGTLKIDDESSPGDADQGDDLYTEGRTFLLSLLYQMMDKTSGQPTPEEARREDLLLFLAKLTEREKNIADAAKAEPLMGVAELARALPGGFLEFRPQRRKGDLVRVSVYDGVHHRVIGELTFQHVYGSYAFRGFSVVERK